MNHSGSGPSVLSGWKSGQRKNRLSLQALIIWKPDIRWKDPAQLAQLPAVQLSILNNVSAYVRPGGVLVYATCTVLPEENGGVVSAFLDVHPDFTKEEFTLPGIGSCPGDVTLWPQRTGTDGFYICRMRRRG